MSGTLWCHVCKTEKPEGAFSKPEGGSGLPLACTDCQALGWTWRARRVKEKPKAGPEPEEQLRQPEFTLEIFPQVVPLYWRYVPRGRVRRYRARVARPSDG